MSAGAPAQTLLRLTGCACERDGRVLFAGLDLTLDAGGCVELRGPNGSGKSTLLRAVAGLYPEVSGTIESSGSLYLGHRPGLAGRLSAAENLRWYLALQQAAQANPADAEGIGAALARVGMAGYDDVLCQHLSAGQQRRVGLARLLLGGPKLWLLDEPLTALDAAGVELVRGLIGGHVGGGGAVLCATHQPLGVAGAGTLSFEDANAGHNAGYGDEAGHGGDGS